MGFKCGIVGLPNVGKSTLFNALTKAGIQAENYPFCTIETNVGVVPVPDPRLQKLVDIVDSQNTIATTMEFVDIAGLVAGASKGEGLGNQFLANIRKTDAIAHVVRCFDHDDVIHVAGQVDPLADIETINIELVLADLEAMERALQRITKMAKSGNKDAKAQQAFYQKLHDHLAQGHPARTLEMTDADREWLKTLQMLTTKPTLYVANVNEQGFEHNPHLDMVHAHAVKEGANVVAVCAVIEMEIADLDEEDASLFLAEMNLEEPGLNRVIRAGYELLNLQTYFTAGKKEVRAWTIPVGYTAPQAAGKIHTDFETGFIRAEIVGYDDYIAGNGEQGAKEAGKWRLEGKDYIVQDGDVIHFRFNV